jgi:hypothetical protein
VKGVEINYFYEALFFVHINEVKHVLPLTFIEIRKKITMTHPLHIHLQPNICVTCTKIVFNLHGDHDILCLSSKGRRISEDSW